MPWVSDTLVCAPCFATTNYNIKPQCTCLLFTSAFFTAFMPELIVSTEEVIKVSNGNVV